MVMRLLRPLTLMGVALAAVAGDDPATIPVTEVTVFKDGHAFVAHEGVVKTDSDGNVALDYLPTPVLGTFWSACLQEGATLKAVVAAQRHVTIERTALQLRQLIEANPNQDCTITEQDGLSYRATIQGLPVRSSEEMERTNPPGTAVPQPVKGDVVFLKTEAGTKVLPLERIRDVVFLRDPVKTIKEDEIRNRLVLKLDWGGAAPAPEARVGMVYFQRGLRWIPSYKIELDGAGKARLILQGTLVNELTDLENANVNFVVGVPSIKFANETDPMALQSLAVRVVASTEGGNLFSNTSNTFSNNVLMTQVSGNGGFNPESSTAGGAVNLGPEVGAADQREELFVFRATGVTLKRGERMVMRIAEYDAAYRDVYALDIPVGYTTENGPSVSDDASAQIAHALKEPRVMHRIRLTNAGPHPFTTAPALLLQEGTVLAQSMMTYAAVGAEVDLDVTKAVDIQVALDDQESGRTPNATQWMGQQFQRIALSGKLTLFSLRSEPVEVEVTRHLYGEIDSAGQDGKIRKVNAIEDADPSSTRGSWPYVWLNGRGEITWKATLQPRQPAVLEYAWHYFWK
ncbi:MAG: hypothetical protein K1Y02_09715 [Candidatus Hydrogenedentes bacterium]|nr:hypothetical protein [Candidatus Hydrogenedentota bacterium]